MCVKKAHFAAPTLLLLVVPTTSTPPSLSPSLHPCAHSSAHLVAGWHCYRYTGGIYGVRAYGKNKKASVNTCGKHCPVSSPPTGVHSLIRDALIRRIDLRSDSTLPESSHKTFISNGTGLKYLPRPHLQTSGGGLLLLKLAGTVSPCVSAEQSNTKRQQPLTSAWTCFSHTNNSEADITTVYISLDAFSTQIQHTCLHLQCVLQMLKYFCTQRQGAYVDYTVGRVSKLEDPV